MPDPRLSLNRVTVRRETLPSVIELAVAAGIPAVGVWRRDVRDGRARHASRRLRDAGLRVSSLCFAGHLTSSDPAALRLSIDDTRRALDEAAELRAPALVVVPGGLENGSRDVPAALESLRRSIGGLEQHAQDVGVRLALEPMHPLLFAQIGVLPTLDSTLNLIQDFSPAVGVMVDTFHTWWDPGLLPAIARAGTAGRIAGVQLDDFVTPLAAEPVNSRGHLGEGHIDWAPIVRAIEAAGFRGDYEVEIFSDRVWAADPVRTAQRVRDDHRRIVEPLLAA